jgi:hypothetical protein
MNRSALRSQDWVSANVRHVARNAQSLEASGFEILVEHADRIAADYVLRSRNGVCGDRDPQASASS